MTDSVEYSPGRRRRRRKQLAAQEKRWAAKAGPVITRQLETSKHPDAAEADDPDAGAPVKDDAES